MAGPCHNRVGGSRHPRQEGAKYSCQEYEPAQSAGDRASRQPCRPGTSAEQCGPRCFPGHHSDAADKNGEHPKVCATPRKVHLRVSHQVHSSREYSVLGVPCTYRTASLQHPESQGTKLMGVTVGASQLVLPPFHEWLSCYRQTDSKELFRTSRDTNNITFMIMTLSSFILGQSRSTAMTVTEHPPITTRKGS